MWTSLDFFLGHHNLLGFADPYVFKISMIFSSQNWKLVNSFKSLLLNTRQGSGIVHFTVFAPNCWNKNTLWIGPYYHVFQSISFNFFYPSLSNLALPIIHTLCSTIHIKTISAIGWKGTLIILKIIFYFYFKFMKAHYAYVWVNFWIWFQLTT